MAARVTWPDGSERLFVITGISFQIGKDGVVTTSLQLEFWTAAIASAYSSGSLPPELSA